MIKYGKIFKLLGLGHCARLIQPASNVRVTYTHEVKNSDLSNFESLVRYLCRRRTVICPEEFFSAYECGAPLTGRSLMMSFDDGLLSSYHAAKRILEPNGIRAIFFVPTAALELKSAEQMRQFAASNIYYDPLCKDSLCPEEYEFMTEKHLLDLVSAGCMVCPHTHSHMRLSQVADAETAEREIVRPKKILEGILSREIRAFAFPVGTDREASSFAYRYIRQNYAYCFTALNGTNRAGTEPYTLHRDCLPADSPLPYVRMVMDGAYDIYYAFKMRRLAKAVAASDAQGRPMCSNFPEHRCAENTALKRQYQTNIV